MNLANATPQAALLADIVAGSQPTTLACCGDTARSVAEPWCQRHPDRRLLRLSADAPDLGLPGDRVPDLALVTETLERLPRETGALLLGQLRNYGTREIAVLVHASAPWTFTDFLGLGFRRQARLPSDPDLTLYSYNLDSYNHTRTWNNPEHWANPHLWGKAWW